MCGGGDAGYGEEILEKEIVYQPVSIVVRRAAVTIEDKREEIV